MQNPEITKNTMTAAGPLNAQSNKPRATLPNSLVRSNQLKSGGLFP